MVEKLSAIWKNEINKKHLFLDATCFGILFIYVYIYIYAFSRRFYPKWLTVNSGYTFFFVIMCVLWESNPQPLRC